GVLRGLRIFFQVLASEAQVERGHLLALFEERIVEQDVVEVALHGDQIAARLGLLCAVVERVEALEAEAVVFGEELAGEPLPGPLARRALPRSGEVGVAERPGGGLAEQG